MKNTFNSFSYPVNNPDESTDVLTDVVIDLLSSVLFEEVILNIVSGKCVEIFNIDVLTVMVIDLEFAITAS